MSLKADVVIPVYADPDLTARCVRSVLAHSEPELGRLILVDDCAPDPRMGAMLRELVERDPSIILLRNETNLGFVASANRGLALRERDVVLLNSDTEVTPGWLREMLEVAHSSDRVCAVVPLSNNGTLCSVPRFCEAIEAQSLIAQALDVSQLNPRCTELPTGVGFCLLMRHTALNLLGGLDPAYGRGYHEENDWCMRAREVGFSVLRANRALVFHHGSVSFGEERQELDRRNANLLSHRYPHYLALNQAFEHSPEARVAAHAVAARTGPLRVGLDLTFLPDDWESPQARRVLELVRALQGESSIEALVWVNQPNLAERLARAGIESAAGEPPLRECQIFHRLAPVASKQQALEFLSLPGHAVIGVSHPEALHIPSLHPNHEAYAQHRFLNWACLQAAQRVVVDAERPRRELLDRFHLHHAQVQAVPPGVELERWSSSPTPGHPLPFGDAPGPFFLFSGSDHPHAQLQLALEAYALFRYRWSGKRCPSLLLAGPHHPGGGPFSRITTWPEGIAYLGPGTISPKLVQGAWGVLLPGPFSPHALTPLEVLAAGSPLIASGWNPQLEEMGSAALWLSEHTPEELAGHLMALATSASRREKLRDEGLRRARQFPWSRTAGALAQLYRQLIDHPLEPTLAQRTLSRHLLAP